MLGIMVASLAVAAWRLFRGWRSAADPIIVALSRCVGRSWCTDRWRLVTSIGQATALALAGTSALRAGNPHGPLDEMFAAVTPGQRRLLQGVLILRIAALVAGLIVFVLWAAETSSVFARSLATFVVAVMVAMSAILEHLGRAAYYELNWLGNESRNVQATSVHERNAYRGPCDHCWVDIHSPYFATTDSRNPIYGYSMATTESWTRGRTLRFQAKTAIACFTGRHLRYSPTTSAQGLDDGLR